MPRKYHSFKPIVYNEYLSEEFTKAEQRAEKHYTFKRVKKYQTEKQYEVGKIPVLWLFATVFILSLIDVVLVKMNAYGTRYDIIGNVIRFARYAVIYMVPFSVYFIITKGHPTKQSSLNRFSEAYLPLMGVTTVCILFFAVAVRFLIADFTDCVYLDEAFSSAYTSPILFFFVYAFIKAFVEEVMFRGVILSAISDKAGGFVGILSSALLFALCAHNIYLFPSLFITGIFLGILAHTTSSAVPCIIIRCITLCCSLLFSSKFNFMASERVGISFMTAFFAILSLGTFIGYCKIFEICLHKKAVSVVLLHDGKNDNVPVKFYGVVRRMGSISGYTFHKFFRVFTSPAVILALIAYIIYNIRFL